MKNKEWLKQNIGITMELSGDRGIFYSPNMSHMLYDDLVELIDQLEEPEITDSTVFKKEIVVPQFVADFISEYKEKRMNIYGIIKDGVENPYGENEEISEWLNSPHNQGEEYNQNIFARAWLDGYAIEQPKLLTVIVKDYDKTIMSKQLPEDEVNKMMEGIG